MSGFVDPAYADGYDQALEDLDIDDSNGGHFEDEFEGLSMSDLEEIEIPYSPNIPEFDKVYDEIQEGAPLTLSHVGRVFGQPFWELIVLCLMDSQDASRAIQGAINRLREQYPDDN